MPEEGPSPKKREVIKNLLTDNFYVLALKTAMNDHGLTLEQAVAEFRKGATQDRISGREHLPGMEQAEKIIREQIKNKLA